MKLKDIQNIFHKELDTIYNKNEVDSFFFILSEHYYNVSRIKLAVDINCTIDNQNKIFEALEYLKQEQPIQYIIGETEFYGLPFKVNKNVLIPRPETEELVEWIISEQQTANNKQLNILDIGTGSGCIAISLAKNLPHAKVYALDVSKDALQVAEHNAKLNEVSIAFLNDDILNYDELIFKDLKFDIVVSNPPYVRKQEKALMKTNVLNNEPHLALFVKDNNLLQFYDAITTFSVVNLKKGGLLFFEINEYFGDDMIHLLSSNGFSEIELKQDIFKKDRMMKGSKIDF